MSFRLKKRFDSSKCKTLLQLTLQRLKVLRNKHALDVKRSRADVAKLLEKRQDATAKTQVESVFIEEKVVALYDLLEQFCLLVINRIESMKSQRECPSDLKEAVASLIFAAPRCGDLEELQKVSKLLTLKYGTEFSVAAKELRPDCGVNAQIIQSLSSVSPHSDAKLKLLKEIAVESKINWDYEMATADTSKGPVDLLDGPNHFVSATQVSNVGTHAIPDKQNSRSMSMHVSEVKGQASTVLQNAISSRTMLSVEKSSSLGLPLHSPHQFAKTNTNTGTKGANCSARAPDGAKHPILDPYALAKAQGKMDYKAVSDYMKRADVTEVHLGSMELKQEKRDAAAYGKLATQLTRSAQDHNVFIDASYSEDALQRSKENRSHGVMNVVRDREKESIDLSNSHGISKGRNEAVLLDLETAAEAAFVAASQAAEAARAAAVMVRMESFERLKGRRVVNANKEQEKHSESSSGSVWDENHELAGMDLEHFAGSENCGKKFYEGEIESSRDNFLACKGPEANACPILVASGDSLKYVVFEQTSGSQTYVLSPTQTGYNSKAEPYAFQQAWSDTTQHSSKDSDRVLWDAEHEELGSKEIPTSDFFDSFYSTGVKEQELNRKASSRMKQESIFDHAEVQQDKFVQNDFPVPQFDDYNSEETSEEELLEESREEKLLEEASEEELHEQASEEELPFYLKGRAAVVTEDFANGTALAPSSKRSILTSTSDLINDDQAEESSSSSSEHEASLDLDYHADLLHVSNHKEKRVTVVNRSVQNDVQNYSHAECVSFPVQSCKTTVVNTESIRESSITSPVADSDSSGNLDTPRELRWHSLTSKKSSDLDSSYGKVLSPPSSVKLHSLDEGLYGYEDKDPSNRVNRKLKYYTGGSEDSESVSERSFESQTLRWNPNSSEELNLQPPKPPFYMEDGTRPSKPDPGLTTQAHQTSRGKTYVGMSRRSIRSTRTNQAQEGSSPPSGYEDMKSPSTGDESNYRFR